MLNTNNQGPHPGRTLPFIAATYGGWTLTVRRSTDYETFVENVKKAFGMPNERGRVRLVSRFEEIGNRDVEVTPDMWAEVLPELVHVEVVLNKDQRGEEGIASGRVDLMRAAGFAAIPAVPREMVAQPVILPVPTSGGLNSRSIPFFVRLPSGKTLSVQNLHLTSSVSELQEYIYEKSGMPPLHSMVVFAGKVLDGNVTLGVAGVRRDCTLHIVARVRADRSALYNNREE
ncbi:hypothetical protein BDV93DRAFT_527297 [Ceratobasidium sp. AG-I]|nr:hypothetical protein BDV93DRAFT_527297 [Ceratobasidium sp. AG-I]